MIAKVVTDWLKSKVPSKVLLCLVLVLVLLTGTIYSYWNVVLHVSRSPVFFHVANSTGREQPRHSDLSLVETMSKHTGTTVRRQQQNEKYFITKLKRPMKLTFSQNDKYSIPTSERPMKLTFSQNDKHSISTSKKPTKLKIAAIETEQISTKKPVYLCVISKGRLGNVMFMYATLFGTAKLKNMTPIFSDSVIYRMFKHPSVAKNLNHCQGYRVIRNTLECGYNERDVAFSNNINTTLDGYLQSWMYFKQYYNEIKQEFTFTDEILHNARNSIRKAVGDLRIKPRTSFISVHVRRGDMLSKGNIEHGFVVPSEKYFTKAMNWFRKQYDPVIFRVCSDNIDWCKKQLSAPDVVFIEGNRAEVDMAVLSLGNHTIMSIGTFGWWGAFLAGGETVAYDKPGKNGSEYRSHFSREYKDYFMPNWIRMDDT